MKQCEILKHQFSVLISTLLQNLTILQKIRDQVRSQSFVYGKDWRANRTFSKPFLSCWPSKKNPTRPWCWSNKYSGVVSQRKVDNQPGTRDAISDKLWALVDYNVCLGWGCSWDRVNLPGEDRAGDGSRRFDELTQRAGFWAGERTERPAKCKGSRAREMAR